MLLGPVFNAEMVTTSRRLRYYVVRFLYGLIILFQVYATYQSTLAWRLVYGQGQISIAEMADFARSIFTGFAILQLVAIVMMTPALVGGTIAEERQRKTLHYLLASQLSGLEIVAGKLAARLIHVGVLVSVGLPVVCLIGLFGGIDFELLFISYAGTLTTAYLLATSSILVSVVSRRPREAISMLYILVLAWLFVPTLLVNTMRYWVEPWPTIGLWVNPAIEWVALTSPIYLMSPVSWSRSGFMSTALWGMGLQMAYGTAFFALAALRLRPSARHEGEAGRGWVAKVSRKQHWFRRPPIADSAMLWKEKYVARTGGMTKVALGVAGVFILGVVAYNGFEIVVGAADEVWRHGYNYQGTNREALNVFLRVVCTSTYGIWLLGVASAAASGLTSEREEDTWLTLTSTPLEGDEILRAKMFGPIWALRPVAYVLFACWALGLVLGAIHPLGVVVVALEFAVFTAFLTTLGTFSSLRSKNSTRSLATTMAILVFLNGGYLFCCIPFQPNTSTIAAGCTPYLFAVSMMSPQEVGRMGGRYESEAFVASILGVFFYGAAAAGLAASCFSSFDAVVDRPDRLRRTPGDPARVRYVAPKKPTPDDLA